MGGVLKPGPPSLIMPFRTTAPLPGRTSSSHSPSKPVSAATPALAALTPGHAFSGSGSYFLTRHIDPLTINPPYGRSFNVCDEDMGGQSGWLWCGNCQSLFFGAGKTSGGVCPAGGQHYGGSSPNYLLFGS